MSYELSHHQLQAVAKNYYGMAKNNYQLSNMRVSYYVKIGELDKQGVTVISYRDNLVMSELRELVLEQLSISEFSSNVTLIIQSITFGSDDLQRIIR